MVLKIRNCLDCKDIRVLAALNFLDLLVALADCDNAAVVKSCVFVDILQYFVAFDVF